MPRKRPEPPALNATERRFLDALERIKAGQPTNPQLKKLAALNRLRVTISAVAQEAGQSRTLIGHEGCTYPRTRAAILAAMKPVAQPRTAAEVINRKRDEVAALREAVAIRDSVNAALVARLDKVEVQAARALRQAGRELSKVTAEANHVAGMKLMAESDPASPGEVIPLRPNQGPGRHDQR